jgi:hypothetical protein
MGIEFKYLPQNPITESFHNCLEKTINENKDLIAQI